MAVHAMTPERSIGFQIRALMPLAGCCIEAPRLVGGRERQHIERVAALQVRKADRVIDPAVR
jgi:hypothetical protein